MAAGRKAIVLDGEREEKTEGEKVVAMKEEMEGR
jgi:hypothetical protein